MYIYICIHIIEVYSKLEKPKAPVTKFRPSPSSSPKTACPVARRLGSREYAPHNVAEMLTQTVSSTINIKA